MNEITIWTPLQNGKHNVAHYFRDRELFRTQQWFFCEQLNNGVPVWSCWEQYIVQVMTNAFVRFDHAIKLSMCTDYDIFQAEILKR